MNEPIKVFLSYSHEDEKLRKELISHLSGLQHKGLIEPWHDRKISAGSEWADQIDENLEQADIILFLVSADFINSPYCYGKEMKRALERHCAKTACTIPVIIRKCDWESTDLHQLNGIPRDNRHVTSWGNDKHARDEAWTEISKEIGKVARQIRENRDTRKAAVDRLKIQTFSFEVVLLDDMGKERIRTTEQAQYFAEVLAPDVDLHMVLIPGGSFQMGSPYGEGHDTERPQHLVNVPPFLMGKFPVTQAQWRVVAGYPQVKQMLNTEPSGFKGDELPVEQVSWDDAVEFCDRLSRKTGSTYRLPSEAEWEYACRANTKTPYHFGNEISQDFLNSTNARKTSWFSKQLPPQTSKVGSFKVANQFGLFDMHGNVWEWCLDRWHHGYTGAPQDGSAWINDDDSGAHHMQRGGSWRDYNRSAYRYVYTLSESDNRYNDFGFRVVLVPS